jgi:hypothetical protein
LSFLVVSSTTPAGIMSRATPNMGMIGVASITPTPRNIRFSDVNEVFPTERMNKENSVIARFAVPSVSASESQTVYGSSCRELVNKYLIIPWDHFLDDGYCLNRLSVMVWLPSVASLSTVNCRVSKCQWKLIVTVKNPDVFNMEYVDTLLSKFYKDRDGKPMYPPTHTRNVAHKKAVSTLPKNEEGQVVFTQLIKLPFQVYQEPVPVGDYDGIQFKGLEHGTIKVLVAELVPISYGDYLISKRHAFKDVEIDQISHYGNGTVSGAATVARSYLSYNQNGKKLPPRVYGNPNPVESVPVPEIETTGSKKSSRSGGNLKEPTVEDHEEDSESISTKSTNSDSSDSDGTSSSEESRRRRKKRKKAKRAKRRHRRNKKRQQAKVQENAESTIANDGIINNSFGVFNNTTTGSISNVIPTCTGTQATSTINIIDDPNINNQLLPGGNTATMGVAAETTGLGTIQYDDEIQPVLQPFDPV